VQHYYGSQTPLRLLDEIEFWKHQEQEHTFVIQELVGNLEEEFANQLLDWGQAFAQAEATAVRYIEAIIRSIGVISPVLLQEIKQFTMCAIRQSQGFILFLNQLTAESEAVRTNQAALTVINHIRRESEYLLGIASVALNYM